LDHKWGRNVSLFGLVGAGANLASPRVLFPGLVLTNASAGALGYFGWNISSLPEVLPSIPFTYHYLPGHTSFPGGHDVFPDAPV
jgi:hypothetical protein